MRTAWNIQCQALGWLLIVLTATALLPIGAVTLLCGAVLWLGHKAVSLGATLVSWGLE